MALFGKKTGDTNTQTAKASGEKKGGLFGRKKAAPEAAPDTSGLQVSTDDAGAGFDDFSDFGGSELLAAEPVMPQTVPRHRVLKGSAVGLNIGNATIKAVELSGNGNVISVTGIGMIETPAESIDNGVVMNEGALGNAINTLFKNVGIKGRKVTTSVSGTGALVVRVIEVPRMSDSELDENMATDVDRYIPFPPSEVVMDYHALRELPTGPDPSNMEVLLAAAQREVIDLNLKVLQGAKLQPHAIDVEPLSVGRALTHGHVGPDGQPTPTIDYGHVSAAINIGAAGTEISIFRGDILVFTRTIPNGGNSLTQALVDYLGLPFDAAERVKIEYGDALAAPQAQDGNAGAAPADDFEDWSDFGATEDNVAEDSAPDADVVAPQNPSLENTAPTADASASDDPFDPDYFNQGDQSQAQQGFSDEPRQQHAQKENDANADDSSADPFDFDFDLPPTGDASEPADASEPVGANESNAEETTIDYGGGNDAPIFAFDETPDPVNDSDVSESAVDDDFAFPDLDAPAPAAATTEEAVTEEAVTEEPTTESSVPTQVATPSDAADSGFNFDLDDTPSSGGGSDFSFDFDAPPAASAATPVAVSESENVTPPAEASTPTKAVSTDATINAEAASLEPSAWNLGDLGMADDETATTVGAVPGDPTPTLDLSKTPQPITPADDDMDLDELFGAPDAQEQVTTNAATPASVDDFAALSGDFGGDATGFGGSIGEDAPGVDAETVYSILHPLLDGLASEVRRSLEFHASRYPSAVVQNIEIVGGGAKFKNIDVFLTQSLGIPSVVGNPLRVLSIPEKINRNVASDAPAYAVAVGLALRELLD